MISAYQHLIRYSGNDWEAHIESISLNDVFGGLLKEYTDRGDFGCIIKYVLYAYSSESDMLIIGSDWIKTKRKIFERCSVMPKDSFYEDLIHLKNKIVLDCIQKWLDYQDEAVFTLLQTLKDLMAELQMSCLTEIKKSSGEIDYTQKYLNAGYVADLRNRIKDLESELIQTSALLKDSVKEFREAKRANKSFGLETFFKENTQ